MQWWMVTDPSIPRIFLLTAVEFLSTAVDVTLAILFVLYPDTKQYKYKF